MAQVISIVHEIQALVVQISVLNYFDILYSSFISVGTVHVVGINVSKTCPCYDIILFLNDSST